MQTQRRDYGEAPPKVMEKPLKAPVLPKDYGSKGGYKQP